MSFFQREAKRLAAIKIHVVIMLALALALGFAGQHKWAAQWFGIRQWWRHRLQLNGLAKKCSSVLVPVRHERALLLRQRLQFCCRNRIVEIAQGAINKLVQL